MSTSETMATVSALNTVLTNAARDLAESRLNLISILEKVNNLQDLPGFNEFKTSLDKAAELIPTLLNGYGKQFLATADSEEIETVFRGAIDLKTIMEINQKAHLIQNSEILGL